MKRIYNNAILILAGLISCFTSYGKIVDVKAAGDAARKYLGGEVSLAWSSGEESPRVKSAAGNGFPSFRVFQGADSWVIIAGDDCAVPVLAYGEGRFPAYEEMPDNMKAYLEGYEKEISYARLHGLTADSSTEWQWQHIGRSIPATKASGSTTKGPLTADIKWTQDSPFNLKTPTTPGGSHTPTGCVATAMAIVMRYHEWPEKGHGTIPGYHGSSLNIDMDSIDIEGYEYKWDLMPLSGNGKSSDEEKDAVSTLMLHIGCAVKMDYAADGSATYETRIIPALINYMSYSKSAQLLYAVDFSHDEWFNMIKNEIDAGRPLIYCAATSSNVGHCMVCDGYDEATRMISANWGWGSGGRGWYVLNTMNAIHQGWPVAHNAVFGLEPDRNGESTSVGLFALRHESKSSDYGLQLPADVAAISKQGPFTIRMGSVYNYNNSDNMSYRLFLMDRDNRKKEAVSNDCTLVFGKDKSGENKQYGAADVECRIEGDCVIGDRIRAYYYVNDTTEYPLGGWSRTYYSGEIKAMKEIGAYDLDLIVIPSDLKAGRVFYPQFIYGGHLAYKSLEWYYDGEPMEEKFPSVILSAGEHTVKVKVTYIDDTVRTVQTRFKVD